MTIEIPEKIETELRSRAAVEGLSVEVYIESALEKLVGVDNVKKPRKSMYGMWAKYNHDLSEEVIDENRRDMLKNSIFAEDV